MLRATNGKFERRFGYIGGEIGSGGQDSVAIDARGEGHVVGRGEAARMAAGQKAADAAKGQKWKSVFVLNVVNGCIPSDLDIGTTAEIEEERRCSIW